MLLFPNQYKKVGYMYLLQLLIPAFYLYFMKSWEQVVLGIVLLGLLALSYILTWWTTGRRYTLIVIGEILLMLIMGAVLNPGFLSVVFWPAAAIGQLHSARHRMWALVVLIASGLTEVFVLAHVRHASLEPWWPMIFAGVAAAVLTVYAVRWQAQITRSRHELEVANTEIERLTKLAERDRISQDLHDVLGHELALITLKSQLAERLVYRDASRAQRELREIRDSAKRTLTKVRDYIATARTPVLDEEWIAAKHLLRAADISCETGGEIASVELASACAQALAMSLRELTTNLVRHSSASRAKLYSEETEHSLWLWIADNGQGLSQSDTQHGGHGLSGIMARLNAVNGELGIWSRGQWITFWHPEETTQLAAFSPFTTVFVVRVPKAARSKMEVGI
ncbi:sensor histidine kinase [Alicyclobacillus sp. SO9]|uniref:sensor histidine kinase n=1 Tax=Alicyclobacillus sp. SO9 TaxID=2665646 RepID=UPI0018E7F51B|nr:histidine kinase [Alicyclobacillus sp. SO9]QQE79473.1 hypothetical protein GI364_02960 [Alicyclobacillus sp. SO9]